MKAAPKRLVVSVSAIAAAASAFFFLRPSGKADLIVTFLDVGQGDSIVIMTPGNHTMVVDAGRISTSDDSGRRVVLPFLRSHGINSIDALLLTHPDDDHIGGAATILSRIHVGRLLVSAIPSSAPNYAHVLDTAKQNHVPITKLSRGQTIDFHDSVVADVLNPPANGSPSREHADNNGSLVVKVRRADTSILLTGDAEVDAEKDMISDGEDLQADVLKLGHHGSKTSSSDEFLDRVRPKAAIVSAGRHNVFGHPNPTVMDRMESRKVHVFRTDVDGAITVTSDGHKLSISRKKVSTN